jgi:pyocin large subunit-like protein
MSAIRNLVLAGAAALALTACDNGPSAVAQKPEPDAAAAADSLGDGSGRQADRRDDPVKQIDGKPLWSASRRYTAEQNARRAFERNGRDFGAQSVDEFVRKAHAFVDDPPQGTLTMKRRNGDTLFYDPKANVFVVAARDGAPRTMFRPDEGRAYWEEQKARETRAQSRRGPDDDA